MGEPARCLFPQFSRHFSTFQGVRVVEKRFLGQDRDSGAKHLAHSCVGRTKLHRAGRKVNRWGTAPTSSGSLRAQVTLPMPRHAAGGRRHRSFPRRGRRRAGVVFVVGAGRASEGGDAHRCRAGSEPESPRRARGRVPTPECSAVVHSAKLRDGAVQPITISLVEKQRLQRGSTRSVRGHVAESSWAPRQVSGLVRHVRPVRSSSCSTARERTGRTQRPLPDNVGPTHRLDPKKGTAGSQTSVCEQRNDASVVVAAWRAIGNLTAERSDPRGCWSSSPSVALATGAMDRALKQSESLKRRASFFNDSAPLKP
jgi:hypothetical protein